MVNAWKGPLTTHLFSAPHGYKTTCEIMTKHGSVKVLSAVDWAAGSSVLSSNLIPLWPSSRPLRVQESPNSRTRAKSEFNCGVGKLWPAE